MSDDPSGKRAHPRSKVAIDLSGHLVTAETRAPVRCLAVDMSRNGLGIVCFAMLSAQTDVILVLKERGVSLKVAWCKPDSVRDGIFHAGLGSSDPAVNLVKLIEREGLLKSAKVEGGSDGPDAGDEPALSFSGLAPVLANAHTSDSDVFRTGQLGKLASLYNAFALNLKGTSLYVLLPKDLRPSDASKLDDDAAAARRIFVLRADGGRWKKIWPAGSGAV